MDRKGNGALIVIIIVLVLAIIWHYAGRGCSIDSDCGSDKYCGSDFQCHDFKIVEKTEYNYQLIWPAAILGFAVVIAALILRYRKN
jgi:hypothetical protein